MTARARILDEALELPPDERAELAAQLLESIGPETSAPLSEEWEREIRRRVQRAISGEAVGSPWGAVRQRILGRMRGP